MLYIGTSGWAYSHWQGIFYPESLPSKDKLKYLSQYFNTAEINYSFYHLPRPSTYQKWYKETPADFIFSVKVSRYITHIKKLKGIKSAWKRFLENALNLKEKLGPILFQFPPNFFATKENIQGLENFLKYITGQIAMEFRHKSWCDKKIYNLLKKHNTAWVIADSSRYPKAEVITANFIYIRMHGSKALFSSKYTRKELQELSQKIKKWLKRADVYVYFNNDLYGYAIKNAKELQSLCRA